MCEGVKVMIWLHVNECREIVNWTDFQLESSQK
jgi:hypothetical protein